MHIYMYNAARALELVLLTPALLAIYLFFTTCIAIYYLHYSSWCLPCTNISHQAFHSSTTTSA